jgi:hypothetical protein
MHPRSCISLLVLSLGLVACGDVERSTDNRAVPSQPQAVEKRAAFLQDLSGIWRDQNDVALTVDGRAGGLRLLVDGKPAPMTVARVDETTSTVHLTAERAGGDMLLWTLRRVEDPASRAPSLKLILNNGTELQFAYAEPLSEGTRSANAPVSTSAPEPRASEVVAVEQPSASTGAGSRESPAGRPQLTEAAVRDFVDRYVELANVVKDPDEVLPLYAPKVDYYDRGTVGRSYIRDDKARYFKRWPTRRFSVNGDYRVSPATDVDAMNVAFVTDYAVTDEQKTVRGQSTVYLTLALVDGDIRIAREAEARHRR